MKETDRDKLGGYSWKTEEYHRGIKQFCGVKSCQVGISQSQRAHIYYPLRAFLRLEVERLNLTMCWFEYKHQTARGFIKGFIKFFNYSFAGGATA